MTINPVDMQVILPQMGQVNRIHRGLQFQQQTEQQILGQAVQQDMRQKEQSVQKMTEVEQTRIQPDKEQKKDREMKSKKRGRKDAREDPKPQEQQIPVNPSVGRFLDMKV